MPVGGGTQHATTEGIETLRALRLAYFAIFLLISSLVVFLAARGSGHLAYADEREYLEIARSVARGDGYRLGGEPTAYRPPAWPLVIALAIALKFPVEGIGVVSAFFFVFAASVARFVGARIAGDFAGMLASIAILLYPLNIYSATTLYPQALATAMLLTIWWIVSVAGDRGRIPLKPFACAGLGLLASVMILAVPTMTFTAGTVLLWVLWLQKGNRLRYVLVTGLVFLIPIVAWTVRNQVETGTPTLLSTSSGVNLLLGNNENATASSGVSANIDDYVQIAETVGNEAAVDNYYRTAAISWIKENPREAGALYFKKVANYFSGYNTPATASENRRFDRIVSWTSYCVIVVLTIARLGMRKIIPIVQSEKLFLWLFVMNALFMAIFFTRIRFRQPLDSVLIVEAAVAIVAFTTLLRRRTSMS